MEVSEMDAKRLVPYLVCAAALCVGPLAAETETLDMRLNWSPGDVFAYSQASTDESTCDGETSKTEQSWSQIWRVYEPSAETGTNAGSADGDGNGGDVVKLPDRLVEVECEGTEFRYASDSAGTRLELIVAKNGVRALKDGKEVNPDDYFNESAIKSIQDDLARKERLLVSDRGTVVRVVGLEELPKDEQEERAKHLLETWNLLRLDPFKVGDDRTIESCRFGDQPLNCKVTVHPVRVDKGRRVVEVSGSGKVKFDRLELTDDGTNGSFEANLTKSFKYDVDTGTCFEVVTETSSVMHPDGWSKSVKRNYQSRITIEPVVTAARGTALEAK
jgi:hypothetical protein